RERRRDRTRVVGLQPRERGPGGGPGHEDRLHDLAARQESFAFETTLAVRSFGGWLAELRRAGEVVCPVYFWVESADVAVARVAQRVRQGGHHVPEAAVRQRYRRGLRNFFNLYRPVADIWRVYDNTRGGPFELIAEGVTGREFIANPALWQ